MTGSSPALPYTPNDTADYIYLETTQGSDFSFLESFNAGETVGRVKDNGVWSDLLLIDTDQAFAQTADEEVQVLFNNPTPGQTTISVIKGSHLIEAVEIYSEPTAAT